MQGGCTCPYHSPPPMASVMPTVLRSVSGSCMTTTPKRMTEHTHSTQSSGERASTQHGKCMR